MTVSCVPPLPGAGGRNPMNPLAPVIISFKFLNFNITECGDLRDIVNFRNTGGDLNQSTETEIPSFDDL
jgi:hypothetical protein